MITQLKFVGIATADQDRALRFYTDKLGFAGPYWNAVQRRFQL